MQDNKKYAIILKKLSGTNCCRIPLICLHQLSSAQPFYRKTEVLWTWRTVSWSWGVLKSYFRDRMKTLRHQLTDSISVVSRLHWNINITLLSISSENFSIHRCINVTLIILLLLMNISITIVIDIIVVPWPRDTDQMVTASIPGCTVKLLSSDG
jgi:hypothetical protein